MTDKDVYFPLPGNHMARTSEEIAQAFAGFPERIVELRAKRSEHGLSAEEER